MGFNTASGMDCMQLMMAHSSSSYSSCFNTASGMDCMQFRQSQPRKRVSEPVSIPQAVWIACNSTLIFISRKSTFLFQYRKRYGLHAMSEAKNYIRRIREVSIPQAVWIACNIESLCGNGFCQMFQYRKRYGLHAILTTSACRKRIGRFNTASGMDCMQ